VIAPVGGGLWYDDVGASDYDPSYQAFAGAVSAMVVSGNTLFVGGQFSRGGTSYVCLNNIAQIDLSNETAAWQDVGGGCTGGIPTDMRIWRGLLYVTGAFYLCGGGRVVNYIASYSYQNGDNAVWSDLYYGLSESGLALEVFSDRLIVAGYFESAGGLPVGGIASWNGYRWRALFGECLSELSCDNTLSGYFTYPYNYPDEVWAIRTDLSGDSLWALATPELGLDKKRGGYSGNAYLAQWTYTSGDSGQWYFMGDPVDGDIQPSFSDLANFGEGYIIAAGTGYYSDYPWYLVDGDVATFDSELNNWVTNDISAVGYNEDVFVVLGPEAAGAGGLVSPLSLLLSFF